MQRAWHRSNIVGLFALRAQESSWSSGTRLKKRSPNPSGIRTGPHSHASFARAQAGSQEPTEKSSALTACRLTISRRRTPHVLCCGSLNHEELETKHAQGRAKRNRSAPLDQAAAQAALQHTQA